MRGRCNSRKKKKKTGGVSEEFASLGGTAKNAKHLIPNLVFTRVHFHVQRKEKKNTLARGSYPVKLFRGRPSVRLHDGPRSNEPVAALHHSLQRQPNILKFRHVRMHVGTRRANDTMITYVTRITKSSLARPKMIQKAVRQLADGNIRHSSTKRAINPNKMRSTRKRNSNLPFDAPSMLVHVHPRRQMMKRQISWLVSSLRKSINYYRKVFVAVRALVVFVPLFPRKLKKKKKTSKKKKKKKKEAKTAYQRQNRWQKENNAPCHPPEPTRVSDFY